MRHWRSLKGRAAIILGTIYCVILLAGFFIVSSASLSIDGQRHHAGPRIALSQILKDGRFERGTLRYSADGSLASFATRNPSLWVMADDGSRDYSFGPVPAEARAIFSRYGGIVEGGRFHVPGVERPLADAIIERHGDFTIAVGGVDPDQVAPGELLDFFLHEGLFAALFTLALIGLAAILAALPLLISAVRPAIRDAELVGPDFPDRRIGESLAPRELLPLVRGFNAALDRLSRDLEKRKRFMADVAHELKTPLAILSLQVESIEDSDARQEAARVVARMSNLVSQMLDIERLSRPGSRDQRISLNALATQAVAEFAPLAFASGYELSLAVPSKEVHVRADHLAIDRALGNLIGNAIAHAGGRGKIRVVVTEEGAIDVLDSGPGISNSVRDSLFEPFSRERWDRDGCGLGLHLTREIMRSHGGDAVLLPIDHGAGFRLRFPVGLAA